MFVRNCFTDTDLELQRGNLALSYDWWEPEAFSVQALVVQGEMWLTVGERVQHLKTGDRFELNAEVPHAERYGAEGATYWVARRNKKT